MRRPYYPLVAHLRTLRHLERPSSTPDNISPHLACGSHPTAATILNAGHVSHRPHEQRVRRRIVGARHTVPLLPPITGHPTASTVPNAGLLFLPTANPHPQRQSRDRNQQSSHRER
ncbi:MAG: hypothetical protein KatS3mg056_0306 [Chloroflexus sp.]|nr:MAG: hypothetical protein KatS3mg056_0306 [Chloroflexus sp.]